MKLFVKILIALFILLLLAFLLGPRANFEKVNSIPKILDIDISALETYINDKENATPGIKPNNEAQIIWADSGLGGSANGMESRVKQTEYAIVYLHGYTASHGEGYPSVNNLAKRFGCNLYLSRLAQHGLEDKDAFLHITPALLVETAKEAIAIGRIIGQKIIVVSTSTGSTLSTYLAPDDNSIVAQIMTAPNFDLYDQNSKMLTKPWGLQMFRQSMGGDYRSWNANADVNKYWTTTNRIEGYVALRDLLNQTMTNDNWSKNELPTFIGYYYKNEEAQDKAISIDAIHDYVAATNTPQEKMKVIPFPNAQGHVIASSYMNKNWESVQDSMFSFLEEVMGLRPIAGSYKKG